MKVMRYIVLFMLILTFAGCTGQATTEDKYKSFYIPLEIVNPSGIEIVAEDNKINIFTTDGKDYQLTSSLTVTNNSDKIIRSMKYSVRGYSNNEKIFSTTESYITEVDDLDVGMSQKCVTWDTFENYQKPFPDKVIMEISVYVSR